jgi:hypothetical protein
MLQVAHAGAAELLLDGDAKQAEIAELAPQIGGEIVIPIDVGGTRGDLGVRERPHAFPQRLGRLAQVEVQGSQFHECSSRSTHVSCASAWRSL